ncbi:unnamed protein product [Boreogadus saida]
MLESDNPAIFTSGIVMDNITQQAMNEIETRHTEIIKLENSIRELHDMFMDMAMLVESQGALVDNIEHSVQGATEYVGQAHRNILQAKKTRKTSKRKMILIGVCLAVCVVALVISLAAGLS